MGAASPEQRVERGTLLLRGLFIDGLEKTTIADHVGGEDDGESALHGRTMSTGQESRRGQNCHA